MTSTDYQQLQLLHQIQHHTIPVNNVFFLFITIALPLPVSWRLAIYHFFTTLPLAPLTPIEITFLITLGPVLGIVFIFILVKFLIWFIQTLLAFLLSRFFDSQYEKTFLELTLPHDMSKSAFATEQLYLLLHTLARQRSRLSTILKQKKTYSLEIVSSKDLGIRYIIVVSSKNADILKRSLLSFLPALKIKEVEDYLTVFSSKQLEHTQGKGGPDAVSQAIHIVELKLSSHPALPLNTQTVLSENDPVAYLTGHMTQLTDHEFIAFQIVTTPVLSSIHKDIMHKMKRLRYKIYHGHPLTSEVSPGFFQQLTSLSIIGIVWILIKAVFKVCSFFVMFGFSMVMAFLDHSGKTAPYLQTPPPIRPQEVLNPYEQELQTRIKAKIDQHLFEATIRVLVAGPDAEALGMRVSGILASFGQMTSSYQSLITKGSILPSGLMIQHRLYRFIHRMLSSSSVFHQNPILSSSELADLYHFPYMSTTKTEGLVTSKSRELPTPLSQKKSSQPFDVVMGKNVYGGQETPIGLTLSERRQHTYIIGKTGMGKTTLIQQMAYQDILSGKGVCVIDPHGDMVKELLLVIPEHRKKDVIYVNPADKAFPVGLNILSPGGLFEDREERDEMITGALLSVFMKITPKEHWGQRLEHILRNATLTALQIPSSHATPYTSLFTIQKLLTDSTYRNAIIGTLSDPVLQQFWQKEFSLYGNMQLASVISPLTNKLGEFITSTMSRHILLQEKTTVPLSTVLDEGKILLCNLSKGALGEDRSAFFGVLLVSLIQLAAYQRVQVPENLRRDFFLYIDEFQNFATPSFASLLSEARKYHVFVTPSHQNIAQIEDATLLKVLLGNIGVIISLKNGPDDERFLLPFFEPEVSKGEIVNLTPHHFFMKVTNEYSEDAFSGETIPLTISGGNENIDEIISLSRKRYATPRAEVEKQLTSLFRLKRMRKPRKPSAPPTPKDTIPGEKRTVHIIKRGL